MISSVFPYQEHRRLVFDSEMAYVEVGRGDPIVLLHSNPTSSYLRRNVLPHLRPLGRCIAPDLIGMGDSDKLPNSGPGSYRFVEHRRHLDGLLEALSAASDLEWPDCANGNQKVPRGRKSTWCNGIA
jgi:haloalkane dehalogenase